MTIFVISLVSIFFVHFKYGEQTAALLTPIVIFSMIITTLDVLFEGTVPEIIFFEWIIEKSHERIKRFLYKQVAERYNWTKIKEMKKGDDFLKLFKKLFNRALLYYDEIEIDYLEPILHRIFYLLKYRISFFSEEDIDALISIEKILEENNLNTINLSIRIIEILEDEIHKKKERELKQLKELLKEKNTKQINLKVLSDVLAIKQYKPSFMQFDNDSEISFFVTIPKEDIILISGLKDFQTFYTETITNLYKKKKISNNFALNNYLDFNLRLMFFYSPLAIEEIEENTEVYDFHNNSVTVYLDFNEQENKELDNEFEKLFCLFDSEYDENITIKYDLYKSEDYFLEGNENYEQRELFEKIINTLFFQKYKMTVYEFLLETTYRINIEEVDEKIKNHLQRIHRQVLFEAYEEMISKNNK